ncbi:hypothetical protein EYF80_043563 [Liparis tanakae]|uniref:Uncharacterized protein n=1 Tax=Liparis tanakae TaxID=230148 RepID=A0A4Z2FZD2_9TELE|nr:hypothetical protein EYF80_043563 [Liparis tanakae]
MSTGDMTGVTGESRQFPIMPGVSRIPFPTAVAVGSANTGAPREVYSHRVAGSLGIEATGALARHFRLPKHVSASFVLSPRSGFK